MGVNTGFKQTEAGLIPADWSAVPAGSLGWFRGGNGFPLALQGGARGDYPFFKVSDMNNEGNDYRMVVANNYIDEATRKQLGATVFPADAIVFAKVGAAVHLERKKLLDRPSCIDNNMAAFVVERGEVDHRFVHRFLLTFRLGSLVSTTALPSLSGNVLRTISIPLPPTRKEQASIAEVLLDADALIESLGQLLAKKRQIKQGAMQELLTGRRRLPGFEKAWIAKRLDVLADIRSGGTPSTSRSDFWGGEIAWCTPTDITDLENGKYLRSTVRSITREGLAASSAEMIPAGSVVMTSRATIGECAINSVDLTTNQGFKNFVPFASTDVDFLYYLLQTHKRGFISLCGGSTFLEIGKSQVAAYEVQVPPTRDEQSAIALVLSDMDAEIEALNIKLAKARDLKNGMMQALLTGAIRLPVDTAA